MLVIDMKNSVQLSNFKDEYLPDIYEIYSDQDQRLNILPKRQYITFEQFESTFKRHIQSKYTEFKIISNDKGDFIGFVIAYDYMKNDNHMKITVYIKPEFQSRFYGIFAAAKFIDYLFKFYNINKIFTEVYEFNNVSLKIHDSLGLCKEACLKEYKYYNGRYYDMYIYSMSRDLFYSIAEKKRLL